MADLPTPDNFSTANSAATSRGPFAKNWNLATKSLAEQEQKRGVDKVWGKWAEIDGFPQNAAATIVQRYHFIDAYLNRELRATPHPTRRGSFLHPDLNSKDGSTRAWLMHKILLRLLSQGQPNHVTADGELNLPEDLPKVVNDLNVLRLHHKRLPAGNQRTLQHYKTMEELGQAVQPFRPKHPISKEERLVAHERFLKLTDNKGAIIYQGNGEAELLAVLPNGAEVIHLKTEAASLAYGSPRWCTAYRERKTLFDAYSDDLITLINPDGNRWQFHFRKMHLMDSQDDPIKDLPKFFAEHAGLTDTLMPAMLRALPGIPALSPADDPARAATKFLTVAQQVPEWRAALAKPEHLAGTLLQHGTRNPALNAMLKVIKEVPEWLESINQHDVVRNLLVAAQQNRHFDDSIIELIRTAKTVPPWQATLCEPDMLPSLFRAAIAEKRMDFAVELFQEVTKTPEFKKAMPPDILIPLLQYAAVNEKNYSAESFRASSTHGRVGVMGILREAKPDDRSGDSFAQFFAQISGEVTEKAFVDIPAWRETLAKPEGLPAALAIVASNRNLNKQITSIMAKAKTVPEWHAALAEPAGLPAALIGAIGSDHDLKAFGQILNDGLKDPIWKVGLAKPEGLPAVITAATATKNDEATLRIIEALRIEQPDNREWGDIIPGSTIMAAIKSAVENHASEKAQKILERTHYIQPWRDAMIASPDIPDLVAKAASQPASRDNLEVGLGALMASAFLTEWQQQTSGDQVLKLFQQAVALKADIAVERILSHAKYIPHWRDRLAQADGIAAAIDHNVSSGSDGYWVQEKIRYGVKDVPEWATTAGSRPTNAAMQQYPAAKIADAKKAAG